MTSSTNTKFQNKQINTLVKRKIPPPCICIVGYSGSGKTQVMTRLIEIMTGLGLRVGTIKHDVHGFGMDKPGKDSWRHKKAGALTTIVPPPFQIGMVKDVNHDHQPDELLPMFEGMDIVLVEGFKRSQLPKIEIFRHGNAKPPACKGDKNLLALVSDVRLDWGGPWFNIETTDQLAIFITNKIKRLNVASNSGYHILKINMRRAINVSNN
jgi:molybdopterin-guanine dinucleotide biosynthesis protein B